MAEWKNFLPLFQNNVLASGPQIMAYNSVINEIKDPGKYSGLGIKPLESQLKEMQRNAKEGIPRSRPVLARQLKENQQRDPQMKKLIHNMIGTMLEGNNANAVKLADSKSLYRLMKILFSDENGARNDQILGVKSSYIKNVFDIFMTQKFGNMMDPSDRENSRGVLEQFFGDRNYEEKFSDWMVKFGKTFRTVENNRAGFVNNFMMDGIDGKVFQTLIAKLKTSRNLTGKEEDDLRQFHNIFKSGVSKQSALEADTPDKYLALLTPVWKDFVEGLKGVDIIFGSSQELTLNLLRDGIMRSVNTSRVNGWSVKQMFPYVTGQFQEGIDNRTEEPAKNKAVVEMVGDFIHYLKENRPDFEGSGSENEAVREIERHQYSDQFETYKVILTVRTKKLSIHGQESLVYFTINLNLTSEEIEELVREDNKIDGNGLHDVIKQKIVQWRERDVDSVNSDYGDDDEFFMNMIIQNVAVQAKYKPTRPFSANDFDFTAFCRGEMPGNLKEFILGDEYVDCGICLYETFWKIRKYKTVDPVTGLNGMDLILKKGPGKLNKNQISDMIIRDFYEDCFALGMERLDFAESVFLGNPFKFYACIEMYWPDLAKITSIRFYENQMLIDGLGETKTSLFTILIRDAHAMVIFTEGYKMMEQRIRNAEGINRYFKEKSVKTIRKMAPFTWGKARREAGRKNGNKRWGKANKKKKTDHETFMETIAEDDGEEDEEEESDGELIEGEEVQVIKKKSSVTTSKKRTFLNTGNTNDLLNEADDVEDEEEQDGEEGLIKINFKDSGQKILADFETNLEIKQRQNPFSMYTCPIESYIRKGRKTKFHEKYLDRIVSSDQEAVEFIKLKYPLDSKGNQLEWGRLTMTPNPWDPTRFDLSFDFETFPDHATSCHVPYLLCITNIHNKDEKFHFYGLECVAQFFDWLEHSGFIVRAVKKMKKTVPHKKVSFWSFNGARFDMHFIIKELLFRFTTSVLDLNNLKVVRVNGDNVVFYDFCAIIPGTLKKIAQTFKVATQKLDFDHTKARLDTLVEIYVEATKYCYYDCMALGDCVLAYMKKMVEEFGISPYQISTSAGAMAYFRTRFLKEDEMNIKSLPKAAESDVSKAYTGGRCEALQVSNACPDFVKSLTKEFWYSKTYMDEKLGKQVTDWYLDIEKIRKNIPSEIWPEDIWAYDINSSYPYAMQSCDIPAELLNTTTELISYTYDNWELLEDHSIYVVANFKFSDWVQYPHIQVKDEAGLIWYPKQYNGGYLCLWGIELRQGFEYGLFDGPILTIKSHTFRVSKLFKEYIEELYKRRLIAKEQKDAILDTLFKLFMNGLYGKWGQKKYPKIYTVLEQQLHYTLEVFGSLVDFVTDFAEVKVKPALRKVFEKTSRIIQEEVDEEGDEYSPDMMEQQEGKTLYKIKVNTNDYACFKHISGYITAVARTNLFKPVNEMLRKIEIAKSLDVYLKKLILYYCDTDSLYMNQEMDPKFVDPDRLGAWKMEKKIFLIVALAPKLYMYVDAQTFQVTFKAKGIRLAYLNPMVYISLAQGIYNGNGFGVVDIFSGCLFERNILGVTFKDIRKMIRITNRRLMYRDGRTSPAYEVGKMDHEDQQEDIEKVVDNFIAEEEKINAGERDDQKLLFESNLEIIVRPFNVYLNQLKALEKSHHYSSSNKKVRAEDLIRDDEELDAEDEYSGGFSDTTNAFSEIICS